MRDRAERRARRAGRWPAPSASCTRPRSQEQPRHVPAPRADRHAHADLLRALGDRVGDDAVDADRGQHQADRREQGEQRREDPVDRPLVREHGCDGFDGEDRLVGVDRLHGAADRRHDRCPAAARCERAATRSGRGAVAGTAGRPPDCEMHRLSLPCWNVATDADDRAPRLRRRRRARRHAARIGCCRPIGSSPGKKRSAIIWLMTTLLGAGAPSARLEPAAAPDARRRACRSIAARSATVETNGRRSSST